MAVTPRVQVRGDGSLQSVVGRRGVRREWTRSGPMCRLTCENLLAGVVRDEGKGRTRDEALIKSELVVLFAETGKTEFWTSKVRDDD